MIVLIWAVLCVQVVLTKPPDYPDDPNDPGDDEKQFYPGYYLRNQYSNVAYANKPQIPLNGYYNRPDDVELYRRTYHDDNNNDKTRGNHNSKNYRVVVKQKLRIRRPKKYNVSHIIKRTKISRSKPIVHSYQHYQEYKDPVKGKSKEYKIYTGERIGNKVINLTLVGTDSDESDSDSVKSYSKSKKHDVSLDDLIDDGFQKGYRKITYMKQSSSNNPSKSQLWKQNGDWVAKDRYAELLSPKNYDLDFGADYKNEFSDRDAADYVSNLDTEYETNYNRNKYENAPKHTSKNRYFPDNYGNMKHSLQMSRTRNIKVTPKETVYKKSEHFSPDYISESELRQGVPKVNSYLEKIIETRYSKNKSPLRSKDVPKIISEEEEAEMLKPLYDVSSLRYRERLPANEAKVKESFGVQNDVTHYQDVQKSNNNIEPKKNSRESTEIHHILELNSTHDYSPEITEFGKRLQQVNQFLNHNLNDKPYQNVPLTKDELQVERSGNVNTAQPIPYSNRERVTVSRTDLVRDVITPKIDESDSYSVLPLTTQDVQYDLIKNLRIKNGEQKVWTTTEAYLNYEQDVTKNDSSQVVQVKQTVTLPDIVSLSYGDEQKDNVKEHDVKADYVPVDDVPDDDAKYFTDNTRIDQEEVQALRNRPERTTDNIYVPEQPVLNENRSELEQITDAEEVPNEEVVPDIYIPDLSKELKIDEDSINSTPYLSKEVDRELVNPTSDLSGEVDTELVNSSREQESDSQTDSPKGVLREGSNKEGKYTTEEVPSDISEKVTNKLTLKTVERSYHTSSAGVTVPGVPQYISYKVVNHGTTTEQRNQLPVTESNEYVPEKTVLEQKNLLRAPVTESNEIPEETVVVQKDQLPVTGSNEYVREESVVEQKNLLRAPVTETYEIPNETVLSVTGSNEYLREGSVAEQQNLLRTPVTTNEIPEESAVEQESLLRVPGTNDISKEIQSVQKNLLRVSDTSEIPEVVNKEATPPVPDAYDNVTDLLNKDDTTTYTLDDYFDPVFNVDTSDLSHENVVTYPNTEIEYASPFDNSYFAKHASDQDESEDGSGEETYAKEGPGRSGRLSRHQLKQKSVQYDTVESIENKPKYDSSENETKKSRKVVQIDAVVRLCTLAKNNLKYLRKLVAQHYGLNTKTADENDLITIIYILGKLNEARQTNTPVENVVDDFLVNLKRLAVLRKLLCKGFDNEEASEESSEFYRGKASGRLDTNILSLFKHYSEKMGKISPNHIERHYPLRTRKERKKSAHTYQKQHLQPGRTLKTSKTVIKAANYPDKNNYGREGYYSPSSSDRWYVSPYVWESGESSETSPNFYHGTTQVDLGYPTYVKDLDDLDSFEIPQYYEPTAVPPFFDVTALPPLYEYTGIPLYDETESPLLYEPKDPYPLNEDIEKNPYYEDTELPSLYETTPAPSFYEPTVKPVYESTEPPSDYDPFADLDDLPHGVSDAEHKYLPDNVYKTTTEYQYPYFNTSNDFVESTTPGYYYILPDPVQDENNDTNPSSYIVQWDKPDYIDITENPYVNQETTTYDYVSSETTKDDYVSSETTKDDYVNSETTKDDYVNSETTKDDYVSSETTKYKYVSEPTKFDVTEPPKYDYVTQPIQNDYVASEPNVDVNDETTTKPPVKLDTEEYDELLEGLKHFEYVFDIDHGVDGNVLHKIRQDSTYNYWDWLTSHYDKYAKSSGHFNIVLNGRIFSFRPYVSEYDSKPKVGETVHDIVISGPLQKVDVDNIVKVAHYEAVDLDTNLVDTKELRVLFETHDKLEDSIISNLIWREVLKLRLVNVSESKIDDFIYEVATTVLPDIFRDLQKCHQDLLYKLRYTTRQLTLKIKYGS